MRLRSNGLRSAHGYRSDRTVTRQISVVTEHPQANSHHTVCGRSYVRKVSKGQQYEGGGANGRDRQYCPGHVFHTCT